MNVTGDHWIEGARREAIAGGSIMETRRCVVLHFTAGASGMSSVEFWRKPEARGASAHLVIDRDGSIIQCRPFSKTAGHAGRSRWVDPKSGQKFLDLNGCSIGIEIANAGDSDGALSWARRQPDFAGTIMSKHGNGGPVVEWEKYRIQQIETVIGVCRVLAERYNLDDITGHDCIAPERKNDPGPAFPMAKVREDCGFSGLPVVHRS